MSGQATAAARDNRILAVILSGLTLVLLSGLTLVLRLGLAFLLIVILLAGFALWRLSLGELDLQPLRPALEDIIRRHLGADKVTVGSIGVAWNGPERLFDVAAREIDCRNISDVGDLSIASLEIGLDPKTLILDRIIGPSRVALDRPRADITLPAQAENKGGDDKDALIDLEGLLQLLRGGAATVPQMAVLRSVDVKDGEIGLTAASGGGRVVLDAIHVKVDLTAAEPVIDATARLEQTAGPARLTVHSSQAGDRREMDVTMSASGIVPAEIARIWPNDIAEDFDRPWSLDARTRLDLGAGDDEPMTEPISVTISTDEAVTISTALLGKPVDLRSARMQAELAGSLDNLTIHEAGADIGDIAVAAHGTLDWASDLTADLEITSDRIGYQDVIALWPVTVVKDGRDWVVDSLFGGQASDVTVRVQGTFGDLDTMPANAVRGDLTFDDLEVNYLSTLPNATSLNGTATVNLDALSFRIDSGQTGDIKVEKGEVTLTELRTPNVPSRVGVRLDLASTMPGTMTYVANEPFGIDLPNGVKPAETKGDVTGQVDIALPATEDVSAEDIGGTIDLQLENVEVPGVQDGFDLTAGSFTTHDDGKVVTLRGNAKINGKPADIALTYHRDDSEPPALRLNSQLDPADFAALGIDTGEWIDGPLQLTVDATDFDAPEVGVTLNADLARASLSAPALGELKPAGTPGTFSLQAQVRDEQVRITQMALTGDALAGSGSALIGREPFELRRFVLDQLTSGRTDVSLNVRTMEDGSYTVDIGGKSLDVSALLHDSEDTSDESDSDGPLQIPPIVVNVDLAEVYLGGRALPAVKAFFRRAADDQTWATFSADNPLGKKRIEATLAPEGKNFRLIGSFDDLGGIIEVLGSDQRYVRGGQGTLDIVLAKPPPAIDGSGTLRIRNIRLIDTPVIARIFSLASLTGIRDTLRGKGLHFDVLDADFGVSETDLTLNRGRIAGSQVGATANGTMRFSDAILNINGTLVPVRGLNSVLANIPIIGRVLSGRDGEGVFVATYSVTGQVTNPDISVNPLSAIVPGMIRDIFGDLLSHGGERQPVPTGR